jgi:amidohydrolase
MTTTSAVEAVLASRSEIRGWQEDLYRDLHRHPELSHAEQRTSALVAQHLQDFGFEVVSGIGGTGVVGILRRGVGPGVLLRADMDALPVRETTGLPYASTETAPAPGSGEATPVAHACGHDMHTACLLGAARLLAHGAEHWAGTLVVVFQPGEETGDGARAMIDDGLREHLPTLDVAMAQHVVPMPAGLVGTRPGPSFAAADSLRVTVHGRGGHGSMPHTTVDPIVLAAAIVLRLQTLVAREVEPGEPVVITVGSLVAGAKSNVIPDHAVLELNVRTYDAQVRERLLTAIRRVVTAECEASNCPRAPEFELYDQFPVTTNDPEVTGRVAAAFRAEFADQAQPAPRATASEDFSDLPDGLAIPYTYWVFGGVDPQRFEEAEKAGRVAADIPANHAPDFAPVLQPTLDTGTRALVAAALAWLVGP